MAVAVFLLEGVVRIPERFEVAVIGLLFLDGELLGSIGSDFKSQNVRYTPLLPSTSRQAMNILVV